jgi:hypothetical protein
MPGKYVPYIVVLFGKTHTLMVVDLNLQTKTSMTDLHESWKVFLYLCFSEIFNAITNPVILGT